MAHFPPAAALRARFQPGAEARRRAGILLRLLAVLGGGYAVAALFTVVLSLSLPMARAEAVLTATMASFAVFTGAIVWAFAARGVLRAWAGMTATAAVLALLVALLQGGLP